MAGGRGEVGIDGVGRGMERETALHCTTVGLKCPVAYSIHRFPSWKEKNVFSLND